jgi:hypothetical protein
MFRGIAIIYHEDITSEVFQTSPKRTYSVIVEDRNS